MTLGASLAFAKLPARAWSVAFFPLHCRSALSGEFMRLVEFAGGVLHIGNCLRQHQFFKKRSIGCGERRRSRGEQHSRKFYKLKAGLS